MVSVALPRVRVPRAGPTAAGPRDPLDPETLRDPAGFETPLTPKLRAAGFAAFFLLPAFDFVPALLRFPDFPRFTIGPSLE
jgi:hypothetical protein